MPNLTRVFCVCGHEFDDNSLTEDDCPMCHGQDRLVFDPEDKPKARPKKHKRAHEPTCECDACEAGFDLDRELDFG